jgi:hypothetical protein
MPAMLLGGGDEEHQRGGGEDEKRQEPEKIVGDFHICQVKNRCLKFIHPL